MVTLFEFNGNCVSRLRFESMRALLSYVRAERPAGLLSARGRSGKWVFQNWSYRDFLIKEKPKVVSTYVW